MLSDWHLSLLRGKKKNKEMQFWLYMKNFPWLRQLGASRTLSSVSALQREGDSGWQGHSAVTVTPGLPAAFQPHHPQHLPARPLQTTARLRQQASSHAALPSTNSRDCRCRKSTGDRTCLLLLSITLEHLWRLPILARPEGEAGSVHPDRHYY